MSRQIVWQYGTTGTYGSGDNQLYKPISARELKNGNIIIADSYNHRVIEVTKSRQIVWQYGTTGTYGSGDNQLYNPFSARELKNGNIIIADFSNHRVIEVTKG